MPPPDTTAPETMDRATSLPRLDRLDDPAPHARLLSNGSYAVLITGAGTGYSARGDCALTTWSGDRVEDGQGVFVYLRDADRGTCWSIGHQPAGQAAQRYEADYSPGRVRIARVDDEIEACMEVCVAPDGDIEIRRLRLRNHSDRPRHLEVTTCAEVVLDTREAFDAHPAFSRLFLQTEYVPDAGVLLATRRPRRRGDGGVWMFHALRGDGRLEYETDRARFVGRGRSAAGPFALASPDPLSGSVGSVLDPVLALRRTVRLAPNGSARLALLLGAADSREAALATARRYAAPSAVRSGMAAAAEAERALLRRLQITPRAAARFQELAGAILYGHPAFRAGGVPAEGHPPAPGDLARWGLTPGRLAIVVEADRASGRRLARDLLAAQDYWRAKGLAIDLVILCDRPEALAGEVSRVEAMERSGPSPAPGGTALVRLSDVAPEHLAGLRQAASAVLAGSLASIVARLGPTATPSLDASPAVLPAADFRRAPGGRGPDQARPPLLCDNGYGGFSEDGTEYVILLDPGRADMPPPPMPWANVVANRGFGFLASESGAGCTWSRNSRENRLTPWYNDPIVDPHGDALYISDHDAGLFWSPTPGPAPGPGPYEVRHGFGYSAWRHRNSDLQQEVCVFVPHTDPLRVTRVRLTNEGSVPRRLSVFVYYRLVLGVLPERGSRSVETAFDRETAAILAWNRLREDFADGVVFLAALAPAGAAPVHFTCDRAAFIGRNRSPARPAALCRAGDLDGAAGRGLDPCAALQVSVIVSPGATSEIAFAFGEAATRSDAQALVERYRRPGAVQRALEDVRSFWARTVSAVQVETPAPAIDLMLNGWLTYQNLSCRLWGRSALYQSGGAFGFRDQLQDAAALVYTRPDLTREQILLHAAHQFPEGDVLHWWHPPVGRGTRTRFSDDLLWLPYLTAYYAHTTGDWGILEAAAGFVDARALEPGEDEAYLCPQPSAKGADLYAHCCRALDRSLTRGAHGLPLMGTGDWNDGMNRVGREGRGESVWLGFFLYAILGDFVPICERRSDHDRARRYRAYRIDLLAALNDAGWDGEWYRRAYDDDGKTLGSAGDDECRIDALAQAWAVISAAAPPGRAHRAMNAVERELVDDAAGLVRLLAPPFDRTARDPGYIKGYVPGIRENGGQYTHAAMWVVRALAAIGRRDRAAALLERLGPVWHARDSGAVAVYQVEPYVVAADIYGVRPHVGRGGWTWYTGSAGWMFRVALESVLGVTVEGGDTLWVAPRVPDRWERFRVRLRLPDGDTTYEIEVRNPGRRGGAVVSVAVDGVEGCVAEGRARVRLARDGAVHRVFVTLGEAAGAAPAAR